MMPFPTGMRRLLCLDILKTHRKGISIIVLLHDINHPLRIEARHREFLQVLHSSNHRDVFIRVVFFMKITLLLRPFKEIFRERRVDFHLVLEIQQFTEILEQFEFVAR